MAWSLVAHVSAGGINAFTSAGVNTTGADIIVLYVSQYQARAAATVGDNKGNTYAALTQHKSADVASGQLFYCSSPAVGAGHTFSVTTSPVNASLFAAAFSGSLTSSSPLDAEAGAVSSAGASTLQPGSVGTNGELVVTGFTTTDNSSGTDTINSSFTITDQLPWNAGVYEGGALAYLATTGAINPTWTVGSAGGHDLAACIASFKPTGGGPTGKLFTPPNMDGLGSGGPFFSDRLAA